MDRWKAEMGRVREEKRREEKKKEDQKRESLRRKKIQVREKVGKSRNTVFFQWFVAPEGRKVGSLKRRVRKHISKSMYKAPQRSADVEKVAAGSTFPSQNVQSTSASDRKSARRCGAKHICKWKSYQKHLSVRSTFGSWDVEKVHAVVARSTFLSQNVQNVQVEMSKKHTILGPLLEVEMSKKCTPLGCEAHFQVKMYKAHHTRTTFGSWDIEKVHAVVAWSTFRSQNVKNTRGSDHFWMMKHFVWQARDSPPWQKWAKREGFVAFPKTMAGVGLWKRICKDGFRVAGAVQETCWSEMLGGQAADFLRGVAFWSIRSVGLLRWFCATGAARCMTWHHFFVAGAAL